jgi:hypothetical protein
MGKPSAEGMVHPPQKQIERGKGIIGGMEEIARFAPMKSNNSARGAPFRETVLGS